MDKPHTTEYIIRPQHGLRLGWDELWRYRELFYFFTWRDVKVKYKQTLLGFTWAVLQPLAMMTIFVAFFSRLLKVPTNGLPAPIFYFSGLLLWNLFSSSLSGAAESMISNANIIKKVYFPRLVIPLSAIFVAFFDFLMGMVAFLILLAYYYFYQKLPVQPLFWVYYPLALGLTLLFAKGLGLFLAALNVKYRDFRYVLPFFIQLLLFLSPVIYPVSIVNASGWGAWLFALNPLTGAMELARAGFANASPDWTVFGISCVSAAFMFIAGIFFFRKTEAYFADLA